MPKKLKSEIKLSIPLEYTKKHNTITIVFSTGDDEKVLMERHSEDDGVLYQ